MSIGTSSAVAPTDAPAGPWSGYQDPLPPPRPEPTTVAKSSIFPVSKNSAGGYRLDPSAGIVGDIGRAATLPGRVESGETQMPATFDPSVNDPRAGPMIGEATNFGSLLGPRNPMVRSGDLAIPGMKRTAPDLTKAVTPPSQELLDTGTAGFKEYRNSNQTYTTDSINQLANDIRKNLVSNGQYAGAAPLTHDALDVLLAKTKSQPFITAADLDEFRLATGVASKKGESGAMQARSDLFNHLEQGGDTIMRDAVQNYAAGSRGQIVDTILRKADDAKNPGRVLDTQVNRQAESIRTRPRGFNDQELAALEAAKTAGSGRTAAADLITGNSLPSILGRGVPITGGAGAAGFALGGPVGAAVGSVIPGAVAGGLRMSANAARRGAVEDAGQLVRQRSPLFREQVAGQDLVPTMTKRDAITNALIRMEMQRQQQQPASPIEKYDPENYT
jgi:hypothetical protein